MTNIAIENGPVEIVDLPVEHGGSFHRFFYVYQAGYFFVGICGAGSSPCSMLSGEA